MNFELFLKIVKNMNRYGVKYIIIGGMAMALQGMVRATEDIDIIIPKDSENLEKLKNALKDIWNDPCINELIFEDLQKYAVIRYGPPDGDFYLDIITSIGEMFSFENIEAEKKELSGILINVACKETLYKMKKDSLRAIDKADSIWLQKIMEEEKNAI